MPDCFIRCAVFAVERFMKLMQAITKIKAAIMENNFTYRILPPDCTPLSYLSKRYLSAYFLIDRVSGERLYFSCKKPVSLFSIFFGSVDFFSSKKVIGLLFAQSF